MKIASFFSGAGGLDLGFENAGFKLVFANDNWSGCWETFEKNHGVEINKKSISDIDPEEIPEVIGFVGGPPCQSWSLAGMMRGAEDSRGQLFYEYLRLLKNKKPLFFLAENVAGIISKTHLPEFKKIIEKFENLGYNVNWRLLNSKNHGVPQERKRVIVIGYRNDLNKKFDFDNLKFQDIITLKKAIGDLPESTPAKEKTKPNENLEHVNHEHIGGGFSPMYMSRNRRKDWDEPSFTIQAGARHAPLHPDSPEMMKVGVDKRVFEDEDDPRLRRLSVRECARIQTFPDDYIFYYSSIQNGYKMIGNAVPVKMAEAIAKLIMEDLETKKD
ncbi:MAG: DNA cytosine methyltransferase [archaeon]